MVRGGWCRSILNSDKSCEKRHDESGVISGTMARAANPEA